MRTKSVRLSLVALVFALSLVSVQVYADSNPEGIEPSSLSFEVSPGDWRPFDTALVSEASEHAPGRVLPLLFFDEGGQITLTQVAVEDGFADFFMLAGECNGGQCASGGLALNCPTSGGPTCSDGQRCSCKCDGGGGSTSTYNECTGGGGGDELPTVE